MRITLETVSKKHYKFLYFLLKQRKERENISHDGRLPSYRKHCAFNNKKPYKNDWIILDGCKPIGRMYVSMQDEVGVHCLNDVSVNAVLDELWDIFSIAHVYFNVSPKNKILNNYLKRKGLKLIQYTYEKNIPS